VKEFGKKRKINQDHQTSRALRVCDDKRCNDERKEVKSKTAATPVSEETCFRVGYYKGRVLAMQRAHTLSDLESG
jgi:hypothetical protein